MSLATTFDRLGWNSQGLLPEFRFKKITLFKFCQSFSKLPIYRFFYFWTNFHDLYCLLAVVLLNLNQLEFLRYIFNCHPFLGWTRNKFYSFFRKFKLKFEKIRVFGPKHCVKCVLSIKDIIDLFFVPGFCSKKQSIIG